MDLILPSFFARDTVNVARDLLGKIISYNGVSGRIVETEAYKRDPASHAYTKTERSRIMFETYGYVYVYLIYGMYHCLNFTTERDDAGAVLIRAVEPLKGIEEMKRRRGCESMKNLCSGPGKLCLALAIGKEHNSQKIGKDIKVYNDNYIVSSVAAGPRIGITEGKELLWRFYVAGNKFVSKGK
ncbi:DNA-3-methyladenine glycosylase [Candidatus Woesearchaeota archaeon]|nr:DNA-3-methyladenine glycosylase [Candidatus Woesearchaeota archaeon]